MITMNEWMNEWISECASFGGDTFRLLFKRTWNGLNNWLTICLTPNRLFVWMAACCSSFVLTIQNSTQLQGGREGEQTNNEMNSIQYHESYHIQFSSCSLLLLQNSIHFSYNFLLKLQK